jgi:hypothetical protein
VTFVTKKFAPTVSKMHSRGDNLTNEDPDAAATQSTVSAERWGTPDSVWVCGEAELSSMIPPLTCCNIQHS